MKLNTKILLSILLITSIILITNSTNVNAALQSNGSTPTIRNIGQWILQIRQMEQDNGTLGLKDVVNTTNLTSTKSESNGLDIHMEKDTEYGAIAILSASQFGNPNPVVSSSQTIGTTTGNNTGVQMRLNKEWVAAGTISNLAQYTNANEKYKDAYTYNYVAKTGDAISETAGWHSSTSSIWFGTDAGNQNTEYIANAYCGLLRAYGGSIFSYYGRGTGPADWTGYNSYAIDVPSRMRDAWYEKNWSSRAIIVVGDNI